MKKNLKLLVLLLIATLCNVFIGCSSEFKEKTIVLDDIQGNKNIDKRFELARLRKVESIGSIEGWLNENQILAVNSTLFQEINGTDFPTKLELYSANSDDFSLSKLMDKESRYVVLSPDSSMAAYVKDENNNVEVSLLNLQSKKEINLGKFEEPRRLTWSNNSKYLSFADNEEVIIYDTDNATIKYFHITQLYISGGPDIIKVSDDGKHALIKLMNDLCLIDISSESTVPKNYETLKEHTLGSGYSTSYTFINNSEILYTAAKGELSTLYKYNIETGDKLEILEGVEGFSLAPNNQYIAYYIGDTLNIGLLEKSTIKNTSLIFKGNIAAEYWWNKASNKFIFQGCDEDKFMLNNLLAEFK